MATEIFELPNGIRLIHRQSDSPVAHCGILMNTGARDEMEGEYGMSHLIEHMVFKGTAKRRAYHVLSRMEDVGGELNAYTTKEETCVHASFFNNYYGRAFELLSDIVFNSIFPEKEIEKEKEVVVDEINSYKDSPFDLIFDEFEEQVYHNHSLGNNVLGSAESLSSIGRSDILSYIEKQYATSEMVVASVGSVDFAVVKKFFVKYFSHLPEKSRAQKRDVYSIATYQSSYKEVVKDTHQAHCVIGSPAYSYADERRLVLHLLVNYLGGPGLNSKLNLSLRERRGYAYNVEAGYALYSDSGLVNIYFGTDEADLNKSVKLVYKELELLKSKLLGPTQLLRAKRQLTGQIAMGAEHNENQMLSMAKSLLVYGKVDSLSSVCEKIDQISALQIMEVANEVFQKDRLSVLVYK